MTSPFFVVAKAGGQQEAPENSCEALERVARLTPPPGLTFAAECDARMTGDGKLVAFHDRDLFRVLGARSSLRGSNASVVARMSAERRGVRVPTLDEALEASRDLELVIDAHDSDAPFRASLIRWVRRLGKQQASRITIASEHASVVRAIRVGCPHVRTSATALEIIKSRTLVGLGLWHAIDRDATWMVPEGHLGFRIATPEFARAASAQGDRFWVWVVDEVRTAARLREEGATGVFTTSPERLSTGLSALCEAKAPS